MKTAANANDLAVGMRVVVKMTTDGKTAASVKMSAARNRTSQDDQSVI